MVRLGNEWLRHPLESIARLKVSADGKYLVSVAGSQAFLWKVDTGEPMPFAADKYPESAESFHYKKLVNARPNFLVESIGVDRQSLLAVLNAKEGENRLVNLVTGQTIGRWPGENRWHAIDPTGGRVAMLSFIARTRQSGVKLWDAGTRKIETLQTNPPTPSDQWVGERLHFSPNGQFLASVDTLDRSIEVWDVKAKKVVQTFARGAADRGCFTFSPDSKSLAWEDRKKGQCTIAEVATGKVQRTIDLRQTTEWPILSGLLFSPDGKTIVHFGGKLTFDLFDVATGKLQRSVGSGTFPAADFSPDGRRFYCAGHDQVLVFDLATGDQILDHRHLSYLTGIVWSPDGKYVLTAGGGGDRTARLWDARSGQLVTRLAGHSGGLQGAAWDDRTGRVAIVDGGDFLHVWDMADLRSPTRRSAKVGDIDAFGSAANGRLLFTLSGPKVTAHSAADLRPAWSSDTAFERVDKLQAIGLSERVALLGTLAKTNKSTDTRSAVSILDTTDGRELSHLALGDHTPLWIPADARRILARSTASECVWLSWDAGEAASNFIPAIPLLQPECASASPDGRYLAVGYSDASDRRMATRPPQSAIRVFELATGREAIAFDAVPVDAVSRLAFSPDGSRLASNGDCTALIWDVSGRSLSKPASVAEAWQWLGADDAKAGLAAVQYLAGDAREAMALIRRNLKAVPRWDEQAVRRLIVALDSPKFAERERARQALKAFGPNVVLLLQEAERGPTSAEQRERLQAIRRQFPLWAAARGEALRARRCVAVLERVATPDARDVLADLAKGEPGDPLTIEAVAALERLTARGKKLLGQR